MGDNEDRVITIVNNMIALCEPMKYENFNEKTGALVELDLKGYEEQNEVVGLTRDYGEKPVLGISTLSIIATITDILVNKRLSFLIDEDGYITGVQWHKIPDKVVSN